MSHDEPVKYFGCWQDGHPVVPIGEVGVWRARCLRRRARWLTRSAGPRGSKFADEQTAILSRSYFKCSYFKDGKLHVSRAASLARFGAVGSRFVWRDCQKPTPRTGHQNIEKYLNNQYQYGFEYRYYNSGRLRKVSSGKGKAERDADETSLPDAQVTTTKAGIGVIVDRFDDTNSAKVILEDDQLGMLELA